MSSTTAKALSVCFAIAAVLAAVRAASSVAEIKGLTAVNATVELGEVVGGGPEQLEPIEFELRNDAPSPVRILRVLEQCDCTAVEATAELIPPGETARVKVRWDTRGKNGPSNSEVIVEYKLERSGDEPLIASAESHHLLLEVRAHVLAASETSPAEIELSRGMASRQVVELIAKDSTTIIRAVTCDLASVACRVAEGGRSVIAEFQPLTVDLPGEYYLLLSTSDADAPSLIVPVHLR